MAWFDDLARRRIDAAAARGELKGLAGEGRPLDPATLRETTDDTLNRIAAEAGAVPEEILLKKKLIAAWDVLRSLEDPAERRAAMREIALLEMQHGIAQDARRKFTRG
ncbi:DnaJ family domain-containing protein [Paracoccus pacificus]|uniref:DnaJ family domain-containing protein n=1 Tax=Paracoccus pacificus TaxID=1463598 RepID=A0ABW4RAL0_9RHOB